MNSEKIHNLLSRLQKVKQTGTDRYVACCPSHQDKSPSLSISVKDEKILIHCFAGCSPAEILHSVDLETKDLFLNDLPWKFSDADYRERSGAKQQIRSIERALMRYDIAKSQIESGGKLTPDEAFKANMAKKYLQDRGYL